MRRADIMLAIAVNGLNLMPDLTYLTKSDRARFELKPGVESMKAVVTTGNGDYDRLDYRDVPIPQTGPCSYEDELHKQA